MIRERIRIVRGDITRQQVDAIVNAALFVLVLAWGNVLSPPVSALPGPGMRQNLETLRCIGFRAESDDSEFRLSLRARSRDSSWEVTGKEAGALSLATDNRYDQHIFLVRGPEESVYESVIGPFAEGDHRLCISWDRSWATALLTPPDLIDIQVAALDRSSPQDEQVLRAPILYLRTDTLGRFSDVPLLLYWDDEREAGLTYVTYTVILSNEDGGTNTQRLMARWGRTTDIEWCYAYARRDGVLSDRYQGRDHETLPFKGSYEGWHPLLYDITRNNIFADVSPGNAPVRVRLLPVHANLQGRARETVMDRFPWTYRIMAKEMFRELRLEPVGDPASARVSDHRNYAYIDFCSEQNGTELTAEVRLRGSSRWYSSNHGDTEARIGRSGCVRTTVELPPGTGAADLHALQIRCTRAPVREGEIPAKDPVARLARVPQVFLLGADFEPGPNLLSREIGRTLRPGQTATFGLPGLEGARAAGGSR